jgi:hypothetical protein
MTQGVNSMTQGVNSMTQRVNSMTQEVNRENILVATQEKMKGMTRPDGWSLAKRRHGHWIKLEEDDDPRMGGRWRKDATLGSSRPLDQIRRRRRPSDGWSLAKRRHSGQQGKSIPRSHCNT